MKKQNTKGKAQCTDKCPDCKEELPDPVYEYRGGGYSEAVTYCKCGTTLTS